MNAPKRIKIMREINALMPKHGLTFTKLSGKKLRMALRAVREVVREQQKPTGV